MKNTQKNFKIWNDSTSGFIFSFENKEDAINKILSLPLMPFHTWRLFENETEIYRTFTKY